MICVEKLWELSPVGGAKIHCFSGILVDVIGKSLGALSAPARCIALDAFLVGLESLIHFVLEQSKFSLMAKAFGVCGLFRNDGALPEQSFDLLGAERV